MHMPHSSSLHIYWLFIGEVDSPVVVQGFSVKVLPCVASALWQLCHTGHTAHTYDSLWTWMSLTHGAQLSAEAFSC